MHESRSVDLDGPTHYADWGGEGPAFVLVHGLGGSNVNWTSVGRPLSELGRVAAIDLAGFGLTPPGLRGFSLPDQRKLLSRFIAETDRKPAIMVGNSMGGLISMLLASHAPELVAGVILVNPALPPHRDTVNLQTAQRLLLPTIPFVGTRYLRWYTRSRPVEQLLAETMALVCADASRVEPELIEESIAMAQLRRSMPWAAKAFTKASQSIGKTLLRQRPFVEMVSAIRAPTLLIHGDRDRVVAPEAARQLARLRPDWEFDMMDGVGHVPQIEVPERFMATVTKWLEGPGAPALEAATAAAG